MNRKQKKNLTRIIITSILLVSINFIEVDNLYTELIIYLIPYFIIGYDILKKAFKGIIHREVFDENFLMAVATIGAMFSKEFEEAVAVMLFYQIGEWFQSYAVSRSRKNIASLMDIRPDYANIIKDNEVVKVDPSEVRIGEIIIVKVGEKIPIDGIIVEGNTSLNTIALTGESKPRSVNVNDAVISGSINMTSLIKVKTTKEFSESTVSKILDLVENATSNKSEAEDFISKFAHYYTPVVCISALCLALFMPLFVHFILGNELDFMKWISRALTFLVISCPCALVISIPLTFFAGIGGASNVGILIKGSNYLENLAKTKYVAFDKTGTMTLGVFEVTTIHNNKTSKEKLLEYAAHSEIYSNHPIGKSIISEYKGVLNKDRLTSVKEHAGKGIEAIVDNKKVLVGNDLLMRENSISIVECHEDGSIIHVSIDGEYLGHIHIGDKIKETSLETIKQLKKLNIIKTIMLTGDEEKIANNIANTLGIDEVYAKLLPNDKVDIISKIQNNKSENDVLIFVGDGINDAPVIATSQIGVAMGALGSDAAIEAADIVLMDDNPIKIPKAIKIAKKCMNIVHQNIYFAIGVKIVCLVLGAFGIANMWLAIFADVGVMVIDVFNSIRALAVKKL